MSRMHKLRAQFRAVGALALTMAVAGCGGGGGGDDSPPVASPPPPNSVAITGKAVDGPLQGATACYDTNDNRACDSDEPASAAASDAAGNFTINVPTAAAGQHRVIVNVPATAIDADTGQAVGTAFTLIAPATGSAGAQSVFVSPLTTLVQQQMDSAGQSRDEAVAFVQSQLGLAVSPLADFTAATNADNTRAANAARLLVSTQRQQANEVAAAVGQTDLSGATVTQADVDAAVRRALVGALPAVGAAARDPSLDGRSGNDLVTAVNALAAAVVAQVDLTAAEVVASVGIGRLPPDAPSSATPTAGATLAALRYSGPGSWTMRAFVATETDNTAANGLTRYYELRSRAATYAYAPDSPVVTSWGFNNDPARAEDRWWNGSAWVGCPLGTRSTQTPRDASGRSTYTYCDGYERGTSVRSSVDIAGQSMATVLTERIRTLPGGNGGVNYADWGPADLGLLGSATFPTGSRLFYQTNLPIESALAYASRDIDRVGVFSQAVADGGDARVGAVACQNAGTEVLATSLEQMVARRPGRPCIFNAATDANGTSLDPNEIWGLSTVSMGDVPNAVTLPAGTSNYYTTTARMRVSFTGTGNGVVYHQCLQARGNGSPRNCTPVGTGTYTITTLGDGRAMTFNNLPAAVQRVGFTRVFVERAGVVYFGYKNAVGAESSQLRLNLEAANALLAQLGLPVITPTDAPAQQPGAKATNAALLRGVWAFDDADGIGLMRFDETGRFVSAITDAATATTRPGVELGWFEIGGNGAGSRLLDLDTDGQDNFSHWLAGSTFSVNATTLSATVDGAVESVTRFPDSGAGIVGVWSSSLTDLKAPTFAFFPSGRMVSIHPYAETTGACATARMGPPGVEAAPYTYDTGTGALSVGPRTLDTSGCTGLWDVDAAQGELFSASFVIAADGRTATVTIPGEAPITLHRIAAQ